MQDASGKFIGPDCEAKDPGRGQLGLKKDPACLWNWLLSHPGLGQLDGESKSGEKGWA